MPIGQRLNDTNPSYVLTPGEGGDLADGKQISAEDAMILHQNGSQLSSVNWPNFGQIVGPGLITGYDAGQYENGWSGITDYGPPPDLDLGEWRMCPFQPGVSCVAFGPLALPGVALSTDPAGFKLPEIHVWLDVYKGVRGSSPDQLHIWALLMEGASHPHAAPPVWLAKPATGAITTTGIDHEVQIKFNADHPIVREGTEWQSRPTASSANRFTRVFACSLWVGWYTTNNNGTAANKDAIKTISAFVVPRQI